VDFGRDDYNALFGGKKGEEPVFLIRAQNNIGAAAVREWAALNSASGGSDESSTSAREHADLMDAWPVKKPADLPVKAKSRLKAMKDSKKESERLVEAWRDGAEVPDEADD
jgi:hypothetical protein